MKTNYPSLITLALFCFTGLSVRAETATEAWVQRYNSEGDNNDYGIKVRTDGSGNVITAGYTESGNTGYDFLLIKYSSAGVPLWTNRYNRAATSSDRVYDMAVDGGGNVYVTGGSTGSGGYATMAYSGAGVPLWTNLFSGGTANAIAVAGDGKVFVTGESSEDCVTVAYSPTGEALWTNRYSGPANISDEGLDVAVGGNGNVIVTGGSVSANGVPDYATISYTVAGVPLWTNRFNGPVNGTDIPSSIAVDGNGKVFVTGRSPGISSASDFATVAYSGAGLPLWTNRYNGPGNTNDQAVALVVDSIGRVFVTGNSYSAPGFDGNDYATVAYSNAGAPLWTNRFNGSGNGYDQPYSIAIAGTGNVVVTGASAGNGFGTVAYSGAGVPLWTNGFTGPGYIGAIAQAVTVDNAGNVFVTGYGGDGVTSVDLATVAYSSVGMPMWTNSHNSRSAGSAIARAVAVGAAGTIIVTGQVSPGSAGQRISTVAYSGAGLAQWTNIYAAQIPVGYPSTTADDPVDVVVDSTGNVFVAGKTGDLSSANDFVTIGYSSGGSPLWTNRYSGPANQTDHVRDMVVDGSGNVFITGRSDSTNVSPYDPNYATVAYSGAGVPLWTNRYSGPGNNIDDANAVAVDAAGNVFVTGYSANSSGYPASYDFATVAYSGAGVPLWTNRYNGPANNDDRATDVAVSSNGKVFVTGYSKNSQGYFDCVTLAYSWAGLPLWTNRYTNGTFATAIAVDGDENVFVTGWSYKGGYAGEFATVAYSAAGDFLWENRYFGPAGLLAGRAEAVAVDGAGNVIVAGYSGSTNVPPYDLDFTAVAYSNLGVPLWTNRYDGGANGEDYTSGKHSLALAQDGVVVVGASARGPSSETAYDYAVVKYMNPGPPVITSQPASQTNVIGTSMSFNVSAYGTTPLLYQWRRDGTNLVDGGRISGVGTDTLTVTNLGFSDAADYGVIITNAYGSVTSVVASLTMVPPVPIVVSNDIASGTVETWHAANTYLLSTMIYVQSNATLTIEPGTVIKGVTNGAPRAGITDPISGLWVTRGGKLYATGTVDMPITFTFDGDDVNDPDDVPAGTQGQWGGLVLLGKAFINSALSATGAVATPKFDVVPGTAGGGSLAEHLFGGGDDNDSSGALRYVSIRYPGRALGGASRVPGLMMGAVGAGTTIDHVEVYAGGGDGFAWQGGMVNTRHLVAAFCADDDFDMDQGCRGTNQFWFGIKPPDYGGSDSRGLETDGDLSQAVQGELPITTFEAWNVTLIGRGKTNQLFGGGPAQHSRDEAAPRIYNSIITEFNDGLLLDSDGLLYWTNGSAGVWNTIFNVSNRVQGANGLFIFTNSAYANTEQNPLLYGISYTNDVGLNPRPQPGSPVFSSVLGGAPVATTYRGAFADAFDNWADGWTALFQGGFLAPAAPTVAPTISSQPQSVTNLAGTPALFSTSAGGSPSPSFQWRFNGTPIMDATNSTYSIASVVFSNAGDYDVVATNVAGGVTSSVATITVLPPPGYNQIAAQLMANGDILLSFVGMDGENYALERTFSLAPPNWIPLATNPAVGGVAVFTNTPVSTTNNFWRIRSLP